MEDEIACFAGPSHRLAGKRRVTVRHLEDEIWVIREQGSATRRLIEGWLAARGSKIGRSIELRSPEAVKILVAAGLGFSFMSVHGLSREFREKRLKRIRMAGLSLKRPIYLVRHEQKHDSPVMEAFLSMIGGTWTPDKP